MLIALTFNGTYVQLEMNTLAENQLCKCVSLGNFAWTLTSAVLLNYPFGHSNYNAGPKSLIYIVKSSTDVFAHGIYFWIRNTNYCRDPRAPIRMTNLLFTSSPSITLTHLTYLVLVQMFCIITDHFRKGDNTITSVHLSICPFSVCFHSIIGMDRLLTLNFCT